MSTFLWAALLGYGLMMLLISPKVKSVGSFFSGKDDSGKAIGIGFLIGSIVISWLFAKSITNSANLGAKFGFVGTIAYASWYVSIPVVGMVIYFLRKKTGVRSLGDFVTGKYGKFATAAFTLVVMFRLFNEVWSNSAVVGAYFGEKQTLAYYAGALSFTVMTLIYSLRGGLRSSILTDGIQFIIAMFLLVFVLAMIVPETGLTQIVSSGEWTLVGGVDLLLVGLLQSLSYGFHDPVLTDRAFITDTKSMLKGYLISGILAGAFIVVFGFVGVYGNLVGITDVNQAAPFKVAQAFGIATLVVMSIIMMVSAGSTLDSTLSSFAKTFVVDFGGRHEEGESRPVVDRLTHWLEDADMVKVGRVTMVVTVIIGSIPLFAGTAILKATTISGTMVLGLAPIFLFFAWRNAGPAAFHFALWPGVVIGILYATGNVPEGWQIGEGKYAALLGANIWGTVIVFAGFIIGAILEALIFNKKIAATIIVLCIAIASGSSAQETKEHLAQPTTMPLEEPKPTPNTEIIAPTHTIAQKEVVAPRLPKAPNEIKTQEKEEPEFKGISFSGQTMLRLTTKFADLSRPSMELYNFRLLGQASYGDFSFVIEPRIRQTPLRSFSPSNIWLQQGYLKYQTPLKGFSISGGLLYDRLGLFWDGSWFGNLPYLNGLKLDPDMNLELAYNNKWETLGLDAWLQLSPGEDSQNGTFFTAAEAELLDRLPDPETTPGMREALALRARLIPSITVGGVTIQPGASLEVSVIDQSAAVSQEGKAIPEATGTQSVLGADLTVKYDRAKIFGEVLLESIDGLAETDVTRTYFLVGAGVNIVERDQVWFPKVSLNSSLSFVNKNPEDFSETFFTAQLHLKVNKFVGLTTEYVTWLIPALGDDKRILNRIEWVAHVYY